MAHFLKKKIYFDTLDSTNDYLISLYKKFKLNSNLLVLSENQKKGRGRMGKVWFSDLSSLTFSFSMALNSLIDPFEMNMIISVVLVKALKDCGVQSEIKYPNDIIINNNKIAGILTEVISVRNKKYCIIGVGLNVNNNRFPSEIYNATSIKQITLKSIDKEGLLDTILVYLDLYIKKIKDIKELYLYHLYGSKIYIPCLLKKHLLYVQIVFEIITNRKCLTLSQQRRRRRRW